MYRTKKPLPLLAGSDLCPVTLYRLGLVHLTLSWVERDESLAMAAKRVASTPHPDHRGVLRYISERTLRRWVADYELGGPEALRPTVREKANGPVALDEKLTNFLAIEKRQDQRASIPEIIRRARQEGLIRPGQKVSRSTVYRTLRRMGVSVARRRRAADRDSRAFEYPHRLDMVLCDGKHFRAGPSRVKRVALNYLDDATRFLLLTVVGPSESTYLFLHGLDQLLRRYGRPSRIYIDKGPGFVSLDTREILRRLDDIPHLIGETAYPQGHGKVERFNQTFGEDVLRQLAGDPEIDPSYEALELRFEHYRTRQYNPRAHEGLKGESPADRFARDEKTLDYRPIAWIEERFAIFEKRLVSNHHLVKFGSEEYEVPRGLAGSWVTLERRILENDRLLLRHEGRLIELHIVDKVANAHSRRGKANKSDESTKLPKSRTAAGRSFQRDFSSVLDEDGGFPEPKTTQGDPNDNGPNEKED